MFFISAFFFHFQVLYCSIIFLFLFLLKFFRFPLSLENTTTLQTTLRILHFCQPSLPFLHQITLYTTLEPTTWTCFVLLRAEFIFNGGKRLCYRMVKLTWHGSLGARLFSTKREKKNSSRVIWTAKIQPWEEIVLESDFNVTESLGRDNEKQQRKSHVTKVEPQG